MKEAILDISEITHSREMYEAKPKPFASAFIYILLSIIAIAIIYMAVGTLDIVTKANGVVRPNQQVSTVKNLVAGDVISINYVNGQLVSQGDTLFTIDHSAQDITKGVIEQQLLEKNNELVLLNKYKDSINEATNLFDPVSEENYYNKYEIYTLNYLINANDLNNSDLMANSRLDGTIQQIEYLNNQNYYIGLLIDSIESGANSIEESDSDAIYYQSLYNKYVLDYDTIRQQYDDKALEISLGQNSELSEKNLEDALVEKEGYLLIMNSLDEDKNLFIDNASDPTKIYEDMYNSYAARVIELQTVYINYQSDYDLYNSLLDIAVTASQVNVAKQNMDQAFNALNNYKTNFYIEVTNHLSDIDVQLLQLQSANNIEQSKDVILANNQLAMDRALSKYKTDTMVSLNEQKNSNEDTINQLVETEAQLEIEASKSLIDTDTDDYLMLTYYKANELGATLSSIRTLEDNNEQLNTQLEQVNQEIDQAIIKAQIAGRVNIVTDIAMGDTIFVGTHILTIVPEEDTTYKTQILLSNRDVARIKVGDMIKYHFQALPYKDYGELTGHITQISNDAQYNEATGQSYYAVEATLNESFVYDYKGNLSDIKVGMLCEAQVITDKKTLLKFLLEKINILD
jgi:HlyD family secretion protein